MKNVVIFSLILVTVISFGFGTYKSGKQEDKIKELSKELSSERAKEHIDTHEEEYELAMAMGHLQRFADKLYFAGSAKNWKLSDFYAHELEEVMEEIIEHKIIEDDKDVSDLVERMALPSLADVEAAIDMEDAAGFKSAYSGLVTSCNSCHATMEHEFIRIQVPTSPSFSNQDYTPHLQ